MLRADLGELCGDSVIRRTVSDVGATSHLKFITRSKSVVTGWAPKCPKAKKSLPALRPRDPHVSETAFRTFWHQNDAHISIAFVIRFADALFGACRNALLGTCNSLTRVAKQFKKTPCSRSKSRVSSHLLTRGQDPIEYSMMAGFEAVSAWTCHRGVLSYAKWHIYINLLHAAEIRGVSARCTTIYA
jgi:hypothetical protein